MIEFNVLGDELEDILGVVGCVVGIIFGVFLCLEGY